ncbi:MAG: acyl-CoA-binding protein [Candidatus Pseudobacter hemicellulosilyticus]|uniref:Acyl-CoA-binding protein n=1 Tax=Candidatus Pseudobacter hemicellulosilyticus TaxID=3121375 RepID=A0AAJ5WRN2_9BACT|nr:MAG: acyl-CoA-binding protein [Pseudobacter sp.]
MDLTAQFEQAVVDSKNLTDRPSNDTLLQLYSFYKQATEGDVNVDPPANPFDFVSKAKFEAWAGLKGKTREAAMKEYIDLVDKLKA